MMVSSALSPSASLRWPWASAVVLACSLSISVLGQHPLLLLSLSGPDLFLSIHNLPDGVDAKVAGFIPAGPSRGQFRLLCKSAQRLVKPTVTRARVGRWGEAAQMGATTFPDLEELRIENSDHVPEQLPFLAVSAPQLTRLTKLECLEGSISQGQVLALCHALPQLQHLLLPRLDPTNLAPLPLFQGLVQLRHLTTLRLRVWRRPNVGLRGVMLVAAWSILLQCCSKDTWWSCDMLAAPASRTWSVHGGLILGEYAFSKSCTVSPYIFPPLLGIARRPLGLEPVFE